MDKEKVEAGRNELDIAIAQAMLAQSRDCVTLLNVDGSILFMNEAGRGLLEIETDDVPVGRSWNSMWPDEARDLVDHAVSIAINGGIDRFTAFAPTARGTLKWWDVVVSPIIEKDGTILRLLSVLRDISSEKAVEEDLRTSRQRFSGLADNMAQLAWMANADGCVFWYNKRWIDYVGAAAAETGTQSWQKVYHPDYRDRIRQRMAHAFARRVMWEEQLPLLSIDGTYRWFLLRAVPVSDDSGELLLWCATHTDITEQRNLNYRLRQLARVIELSHEAILVWDIEDGIALWNNGCEELYGYSRAEALGKRSTELLNPRHPAGSDTFERLLREDGEWSGEISHRAKDGSEIWVDSRQELIRAGGRNLVIETNRDITERRKSDELREMLVAELNHRVKNTLAIVQSIAAQMARSQMSLDAFMASFTGRIQSLALSQGILADAHWSGAELSELIRSQVSLISPRHDALRLDGDPVMVHPELALQLTLVLHELATNACRHGALAQPTGRVHVAWRDEREPRECIVIDWRELGGPRVTRSSAYGFGRQLIERTGRLPHLKTELQLQPGGAHCRIVLDATMWTKPARRYFRPGRHMPDRELVSPSPTRPARVAGRRVLLVGEDPSEVSWMEDVLADAGFLIVGAVRSVSSANTLIETITYDLVIVDLDGGNRASAALLDRLDQLSKPVIVVTSNDASIKAGVLRKPLDAQSLVDLAQRLRRRS